MGEKVKQNSARNNVKCSKCFQFLCNNSGRTWFFNALTFARSHGRCWKPRLNGLGFQHLPWDLVNVNAWKTMFDPYSVDWYIVFDQYKCTCSHAISEYSDYNPCTFIYLFIKAYVMGTDLNCLNRLRQFKWIPATYAFIKKIRKKHKHH